MSTPPEPADVQSIEAVLVNTNDERPLAEVFQALGWEIVSQSTLAQGPSQQLFGVASSCQMTVLGSPGAATGRVILCLWPDLLRLPEGELLDGTAPGFFTIDVYVRDMEEARRRTGRPWAGGGPETYEFGSGAGLVRVEEGLIWLPDRVPLVFVRAQRPRPTAAWALDPDRQATELTSVVLATDDVDRAVRFLGPSGLGLPLIYDAVIESAGLSRIIGGPPGTAYRLAFLGGAATARVEVIASTANAGALRDVRTQQRPARATGIFGWLIRPRNGNTGLPAWSRNRGGVAAFEGRAVRVDGPDGEFLVAVYP